LADTIPFIKHSKGFLTALAYLLYHINDAQILLSCEGTYHIERYEQCDCPYTLLRLTNGKYRMFLYNPERDRYRPVRVRSKKHIVDASVVSFYPLLPVKYNNFNNDQSYVHKYTDDQSKGTAYTSFTTKIRPNGITVVDIALDESV